MTGCAFDNLRHLWTDETENPFCDFIIRFELCSVLTVTEPIEPDVNPLAHNCKRKLSRIIHGDKSGQKQAVYIHTIEYVTALLSSEAQLLFSVRSLIREKFATCYL